MLGKCSCVTQGAVWQWVCGEAEKVVILALHVDTSQVGGKLSQFHFDWKVKSVIRERLLL